MTYIGLFVDDEDDIYSAALSIDDKLFFAFEPLTEVAALAQRIVAASPMIVAIDYRLDEAAIPGTERQSFKGSALAQHLRDAAMDKPHLDFAIILVSAEDNIQKFFKPDITAHDLFDRVYVKDRLAAGDPSIPGELLSLCEGYEQLRGCIGNFNLIPLTDALETDLEYIDVQELRVQVEQAKAPHHVSKAFSNFLIKRSGILLSTQDACAILGVDVSQKTEVEEILCEAGLAYTGLFCGLATRWWAKRLDVWAEAIFEARPTGMTSGERATRISSKLKRTLEPARSTWTNTTDQLIVIPCACCGRGAELRHTVAAYEPALPRFIKRRRICWDCIQRDKLDKCVPALIIDEVDQDLAEKVKLLDRASGTADVEE